MPNNGRITLCPFYIGEQNKSITCEDTFRRFRWLSQKEKWMDMYCDDKWGNCEYAVAMQNAYDKEETTMNKYIVLEEKNKALKNELKRVSSMLGKCEKREELKQTVIKDLQNRYRALEAIAIRRQTNLDEATTNIEKLERGYKELSGVYEGRFAYLMHQNGGTMNVDEFIKWADTHEYAFEVTGHDGTKVTEWTVTVREANDGNEGTTTKSKSASGKTNSTTKEEK